MTVLPREEIARVRQAMILGLARQPLVVPPSLAPMVPGGEPSRTVLALAAQRQRFERPALPGMLEPSVAARQLHADARPIVTAGVRRALTRLSNAVAKGQAGQVMPAAVARIAGAGLRPHPFDLPWLMPHIKGTPACLGLAERAYLALTEKPDGDDKPSLLHAEIGPETWCDFPKGHRRAFLALERAKDPHAARALLEGVFKNEPAPVRGELLEALAVRLSGDDLPFLESLTGDRADSVKAVAVRLVAQVPGTPAHTARLAEAAACFQKASGVKSLLSKIGLGGAAGELTFAGPKGNAGEQAQALMKLFGGLSLPELVAATGFAAERLLAALPAFGTVFHTLMQTAHANGDDATRHLLFGHTLQSAASSDELQRALLTYGASAPVPIAVALADAVLASPHWTALVEKAGQETAVREERTFLALAMLLPAETMPRFLATLAALSIPLKREAHAFAEFVNALEASPTPTKTQS